MSTFGWFGSVKSRNLVPVSVWKHCNLKFSVSSTSIPEGGSGRESVDERAAVPWSGLRRVVIAWTLKKSLVSSSYKRETKSGAEWDNKPVESSRKYKIVVDRQFI